METSSVGIREFRAALAEYIDGDTPVTVTRHGQTVGLFVPLRRPSAEDLKRLEAAGYDSIETLKAEGVQEVIDDVSGRASRGAMRNRCRALERAIAAWAERCDALAQGSGHGPRATAVRTTTV